MPELPKGYHLKEHEREEALRLAHFTLAHADWRTPYERELARALLASEAERVAANEDAFSIHAFRRCQASARAYFAKWWRNA